MIKASLKLFEDISVILINYHASVLILTLSFQMSTVTTF